MKHLKQRFWNFLTRCMARAADKTFLERFVIDILQSKGEEDMLAYLYAQAIIKGKRTIAQVPDRLKPAVKEILIDSGFPELAEEPGEG